jgi:hypothetical protein
VKLEVVFRSRCEALAVDWRYRLGLQPYDSLPAETLLQALEGTAIPPDQVPNVSPEAVRQLLTHDDWSAGIVRAQPLLIIYHPGHSPGRHQADLMHEIAHVLLEHPMMRFSPQTGLPLWDSRHEDEAVYLGGCLQLPRLGLKWAVQRGYTCQQVAQHFGTSPKMVSFRSNVTGIQVRSSN